MRRTIIMLLLAAAPAFGQLDVRHLYITNDVSTARSAVAPIRWYAGESLKLDLWARRGTSPVVLTNANVSVRFELFHATNLTSAYMMETGTVAVATNGYVTFDIEPGRANVPTNTYRAYVKAYQDVGGEFRYVGALLAADAHVYWGPSSTNYVYQGPYESVTNYVPSSRTLTINGVGYTLEADRTWTVTAAASTNLFTGAGTTGQVTSAGADTNNLLRGDGEWFNWRGEATNIADGVASAGYAPLTRSVTIGGDEYTLASNFVVRTPAAAGASGI